MDLVHRIQDEVRAKGVKLPSMTLPTCVLTIAALFSNEAKLAKSWANKNIRLDNEKV